MTVISAAPHRRELRPVSARGRWIAWGAALQVAGVGIPVATALHRAHEGNLGGAVTHYTVRLVWREMLRSNADVALIVLGVALFVIGAVLLARPFVRRPGTLLLAVPVAAIAGLAVFGVLALVFALVIVATADVSSADWGELLSNLPFDGWFDGRRGRK